MDVGTMVVTCLRLVIGDGVVSDLPFVMTDLPILVHDLPDAVVYDLPFRRSVIGKSAKHTTKNRVLIQGKS
eukprot:2993990-Amphidinium_carterae.1